MLTTLPGYLRRDCLLSLSLVRDDLGVFLDASRRGTTVPSAGIAASTLLGKLALQALATST